MRGLIHDIINDPREYLPVLLLVAGLLVFLAGLCVSGFLSLRASTPRRRFWFAVLPTAAGLVGLSANIPLSLERDSFRFSFDLRWLFLVPLFLGVVGLLALYRPRRKPVV